MLRRGLVSNRHMAMTHNRLAVGLRCKSENHQCRGLMLMRGLISNRHMAMTHNRLTVGLRCKSKKSPMPWSDVNAAVQV